jgi:YgiT-type zinc finger domain-containing protein
MELENKKAEWQQMSEEILSGMIEWRVQHPKATLREIEQEVEKRMARLRARLVQDTAQESPSRQWSRQAQQDRPRCPQCGSVLIARGKRKRQLQTVGGQHIELERSYGTCPKCGEGFFPPP